MEYITVREASEKWGYSEATIQKWCRVGLLSIECKAEKKSGRWQIPAIIQCPKQSKQKVIKIDTLGSKHIEAVLERGKYEKEINYCSNYLHTNFGITHLVGQNVYLESYQFPQPRTLFNH